MKNKKVTDFYKKIIELMLDRSIESIPTEKRKEIVLKSIQTYQDYIFNYIKDNFSPKDSIRLKSMQKFNTVNFDNSPELKKMFSEAYQSFLQNLKTLKLQQI